MKVRLPNPAQLLIGPIFQKEVRSMGRRRATYLGRCLFALGLLVIVGFAFATVLLESSEGRGGVERLQMLQSLAPVLTLVVIWFQFVVLALMSPMLTGDGICEERRARTLSALLTTPLTAAQIVGGKLTSRLVQIVILSLLALPVLLAVRVFGGLSAMIVLAATAVVLSTALVGAAAGLMCSIWNRRGSAAAMQGLMVLGLVQFGPIIAEEVRYTAMQRLGFVTSAYDNVYVTSSGVALAELSASAMTGSELMEVHVNIGSAGNPRYLSLGPRWLVNTGYNLAAMLALAGFTSVVLRRSMRRLANEAPPPPRRRRRWLGLRRGRGGGESGIASGAGEQGMAGDVEGGDAGPNQALEQGAGAEADAHASRTIRGNPVLWRELRQHTLGSRRRLHVAIISIAAGMGVLYWYASLEEWGMHVSLSIIAGVAMLVQAAYTSSGSIASEREGRTWEALLSTPMTARQIVLGKLAGALRAQWLVPTVLLAHLVIAASWGAVEASMPVLIMMVLIGPLVLLTATGQFLAVALKRGGNAAAANLLLAMALFAGSWLGILAITMLLPAYRNDLYWYRALVDSCYATHPLTMVATIVDPNRYYRTSEYELAFATLNRAEVRTLVVGVFLGYLALSAGVLALTCRYFRRFSGRAS
jgi:ABC-type transport system involved in multi-copper enzyme maturation permease subunit